MTKRFSFALALALPLLFLAGSIAFHFHAQRAATLWRIPVSSVDPYLPLRGHYFRFTYEWQLQGNPSLCAEGACTLCLSQAGNDVIARIAPARHLCPHPLQLPASNVRLARAAGGSLSFSGRIFVSEASAPKLEAAFRDGKSTLVARLSRNGNLIPQQLLPH